MVFSAFGVPSFIRHNEDVISRRKALLFLCATKAIADNVERLRGKLRKGRILATPEGDFELRADESITDLLEDERVIGMEIEVEGKRNPERIFLVNPVHLKPVYTYEGPKRLLVAYWCDVCYIRFYRPGTCWCCQKEVLLDPKDPTTPERIP